MKNEESSIDIFLKEKLSKTSLLVGFNPRETGYILNLEGETIEKKINKYIGQKLLSIGNRLEKFLLELGSESARNKFYQSVIFMEEKDPIFHIFTLQPVIDKQLMFLEQETDYSAYFKIYAAFPLVNYFLKNHLAEVLVPPDMIQKQMNDLLSQIRNTTVHPIVRGVLYEKYILERLIKAKSQQKPFALLASPSKYLSYH